jgi:hypothetical protein
VTGGGPQMPQQGPPPVTVSAPLVQDVVDWDEFVGVGCTESVDAHGERHLGSVHS